MDIGHIHYKYTVLLLLVFTLEWQNMALNTSKALKNTFLYMYM